MNSIVPTGERTRVLVADDEPQLRAVYVRQLEALGMGVVAVPGGAEAIARLDAERFDLLILDLDMPGVSGLDVLLHAGRAAPHLPVVVVTATEVERLDGAAAVLHKPVDLPTLRERLREVLARRVVALPGQ